MMTAAVLNASRRALSSAATGTAVAMIQTGLTSTNTMGTVDMTATIYIASEATARSPGPYFCRSGRIPREYRAPVCGERLARTSAECTATRPAMDTGGLGLCADGDYHGIIAQLVLNQSAGSVQMAGFAPAASMARAALRAA